MLDNAIFNPQTKSFDGMDCLVSDINVYLINQSTWMEDLYTNLIIGEDDTRSLRSYATVRASRLAGIAGSHPDSIDP